MTDEEKRKAARAKLVRAAAIAGMLLGLACHSLPPRHQAVCQTVAHVFSMGCNGG